MNTFLVALGGIRVGKIRPRELATQGLLEGIAKQAGVEALGGVWVFPTMPRPIEPRRRKDCVIMVNGCHATLSGTAGNVAAGMPTTEELDDLDDIAYAEDFNRRVNEQWEAECEERAHVRFMERLQQANDLRAERRKQRDFRQGAAKLAKEIKSAPDAMEDLAALVLLLKDEISQLSSRIQELESPQPKPAKRKK
jgi:hypothetical protein